MGSAGSGMAEKWYFRNDPLNHGIEGEACSRSMVEPDRFFISFLGQSFFGGLTVSRYLWSIRIYEIGGNVVLAAR